MTRNKTSFVIHSGLTLYNQTNTRHFSFYPTLWFYPSPWVRTSWLGQGCSSLSLFLIHSLHYRRIQIFAGLFLFSFSQISQSLSSYFCSMTRGFKLSMEMKKSPWITVYMHYQMLFMFVNVNGNTLVQSIISRNQTVLWIAKHNIIIFMTILVLTWFSIL